MQLNHSGWELRRATQRALRFALALSCLGAGFASAQSSGCGGPDPLSRPVRALRLRQGSILAALLQVGYEYQLCLGVESIRPDLLTTPVDLEMAQTTVGVVIERLLGPAKTFTVSEQGRVILIREAGISGRTWLDYRIRAFKVRRADVQAVNNALCMTLRMQTDPSIRGFAGHYRPGDLADLIGPFEEVDKTLRGLLALIVSGSKGGMWIAQGPEILQSRGLSDRPFWVILEYGQPQQLNLSLIETMREGSQR